VIIGEGVTRRSEIPWELVEPAFRDDIKKMIMMTGVLDEGYRPGRPRQRQRAAFTKGRRTASRQRALF
jgi:hypothetical protein